MIDTCRVIHKLHLPVVMVQQAACQPEFRLNDIIQLLGNVEIAMVDSIHEGGSALKILAQDISRADGSLDSFHLVVPGCVVQV